MKLNVGPRILTFIYISMHMYILHILIYNICRALQILYTIMSSETLLSQVTSPDHPKTH